MDSRSAGLFCDLFHRILNSFFNGILSDGGINELLDCLLKSLFDGVLDSISEGAFNCMLDDDDGIFDSLSDSLIDSKWDRLSDLLMVNRKICLI